MQKIKKIIQLNNLVLGIAILFALILIFDTFQAIQHNYKLQQQFSSLQAQVQVQKLANENAKLKNQYLQSNDYLDLAVRQNLDISAPGDKELIFSNLPAPETNTTNQNTSPTHKSTSKWQQNFNDWLDFLFHRGNTSNL